MAKSPKSAADRRPRPLRRRHYTKSRRVSKVADLPTRPFFAKSRRRRRSAAPLRRQEPPKLRVFPLSPNRRRRSSFRKNAVFSKTQRFRSPSFLSRPKFSILRKNFLKKTPRRPKNAKMVFTQTGKIVKISLTMKRKGSTDRSRAPIRPFFVDAYSPTPVKIGIIRVSS